MCLVFYEPAPVVHGRLAQHNAAPQICGAASVGKSATVFPEAVDVVPHSNIVALLDDLKQFFRDNPAWE